MQIQNIPPPNFQKILKKFSVESQPIVFTFGDVIYNPSKGMIPPHVLVHEQVHVKQQKLTASGQPTTPDEWWDKYLDDPVFRLAQELDAYRTQYKYICDVVSDRNTRARILTKLASDLSGDMYGRILTHAEAMKKIRA